MLFTSFSSDLISVTFAIEQESKLKISDFTAFLCQNEDYLLHHSVSTAAL